ncbi:hypothetical protein GS624_07700 [Ruegeria sp. HKCCD5849]|uniref:hypothetical protein n=1 Tax=unclassified Ruegeria TaxID=2625375 RepID=UPI001491EF8D|nr:MULTISPECIES: hypothetical protein [unclassified Ruegeria]NOD47197.1 hypothetical protein [Ruegeria sp. HKCCD5849]NOD51520.1 hypothetical protein [Ruegeria sp. HKCCD5851]
MVHLKTLCVAAAVALAGSPAFAQSDLETALNNGAERLDAEQIAELLIGKTVTATSGEKTFRFFYDPNNIVSGELTNGGWSGAGAFAITDTDKVCVSMVADKGRYRCMIVLRVGDSIQKFNADGKRTFELHSFEPSTGL